MTEVWYRLSGRVAGVEIVHIDFESLSDAIDKRDELMTVESLDATVLSIEPIDEPGEMTDEEEEEWLDELYARTAK